GWHRPPSVKDRLPEQLVMFEDGILGELRSHAAHCTRPVAALAIELEYTSSSQDHASCRTLCLRLVFEGFRLSHLVIERRQIERRIRMIASREIPYQQVGLLAGNLSPPMLHFLNRRLPPRTRQSLLRNEIGAVTDGTACDDQPYRARAQHRLDRGGILLRKSRDRRERHEAYNEKEPDRARCIHHG